MNKLIMAILYSGFTVCLAFSAMAGEDKMLEVEVAGRDALVAAANRVGAAVGVDDFGTQAADLLDFVPDGYLGACSSFFLDAESLLKVLSADDGNVDDEAYAAVRNGFREESRPCALGAGQLVRVAVTESAFSFIASRLLARAKDDPDAVDEDVRKVVEVLKALKSAELSLCVTDVGIVVGVSAEYRDGVKIPDANLGEDPLAFASRMPFAAFACAGRHNVASLIAGVLDSGSGRNVRVTANEEEHSVTTELDLDVDAFLEYLDKDLDKDLDKLLAASEDPVGLVSKALEGKEEPSAGPQRFVFGIKGAVAPSSPAALLSGILPEAASRKCYAAGAFSASAIVNAVVRHVAKNPPAFLAETAKEKKELEELVKSLAEGIPDDPSAGVAYAAWREGNAVKAAVGVSFAEIKTVVGLFCCGFESVLEIFDDDDDAEGEDESGDEDVFAGKEFADIKNANGEVVGKVKFSKSDAGEIAVRGICIGVGGNGTLKEGEKGTVTFDAGEDGECVFAYQDGKIRLTSLKANDGHSLTLGGTWRKCDEGVLELADRVPVMTCAPGVKFTTLPTGFGSSATGWCVGGPASGSVVAVSGSGSFPVKLPCKAEAGAKSVSGSGSCWVVQPCSSTGTLKTGDGAVSLECGGQAAFVVSTDPNDGGEIKEARARKSFSRVIVKNANGEKIGSYYTVEPGDGRKVKVPVELTEAELAVEKKYLKGVEYVTDKPELERKLLVMVAADVVGKAENVMGAKAMESNPAVEADVKDAVKWTQDRVRPFAGNAGVSMALLESMVKVIDARAAR